MIWLTTWHLCVTPILAREGRCISILPSLFLGFFGECVSLISTEYHLFIFPSTLTLTLADHCCHPWAFTFTTSSHPSSWQTQSSTFTSPPSARCWAASRTFWTWPPPPEAPGLPLLWRSWQFCAWGPSCHWQKNTRACPPAWRRTRAIVLSWTCSQFPLWLPWWCPWLLWHLLLWRAEISRAPFISMEHSWYHIYMAYYPSYYTEAWGNISFKAWQSPQ